MLESHRSTGNTTKNLKIDSQKLFELSLEPELLGWIKEQEDEK